MEKGLHKPWCPVSEMGWDQVMEQLQTQRNLCAALEARGYSCLFAIGFGERPNGEYSIKIAARPTVRRLSPQSWQTMRETIISALDKLQDMPFDDLEFER